MVHVEMSVTGGRKRVSFCPGTKENEAPLIQKARVSNVSYVTPATTDQASDEGTYAVGTPLQAAMGTATETPFAAATVPVELAALAALSAHEAVTDVVQILPAEGVLAVVEPTLRVDFLGRNSDFQAVSRRVSFLRRGHEDRDFSIPGDLRLVRMSERLMIESIDDSVSTDKRRHAVYMEFIEAQKAHAVDAARFEAACADVAKEWGTVINHADFLRSRARHVSHCTRVSEQLMHLRKVLREEIGDFVAGENFVARKSLLQLLKDHGVDIFSPFGYSA